MKVCACFLLLTIFEYTQSAETTQPSQRSVNLALETVLEFRERDKAADLKFLNNVQNFISKVKTVIDKNINTQNLRRTENIEVVTFTGFIQYVIAILKTYNDNALKEFFNIFDDEIRKYHYRGCKFYELIENLEIRKYLASKLDLIKNKPVAVIKSYINILADTLKKEVYNEEVKELIGYINSFYSQESEPMFQKVLMDIEKHSKSSKKDYSDMVKVIREGLRSTIFDHYSRLPQNARIELKNKIETFWKPNKVTTSIAQRPTSVIRPKSVNDFKPDIVFGEDAKLATTKPEPKTTKKEIEKQKETTRKPDRFTIKHSDNKKRVILKDVAKDERKDNKYTKSSHIHIPLENKGINLLKTKTKEHEQRAKYKTSVETTIEFSSETQNSFETNSIEMSQELQREFNTKPYMTLYPEYITTASTTKKKIDKKIVHRASKSKGTTEKSKLQTLWIEESTGRIPKHVLDKLNTKHKPAHKTKPRIHHKPKHKKPHASKHHKKVHNKSRPVHGHKVSHRHNNPKVKHEKTKLRHVKTIKHGKKHEVKRPKKVVRHRKPKDHGRKHHEHPKPKYHKKHVKRAELDGGEYRQRQDRAVLRNMEVFGFNKMMGPVTGGYKPGMTKPSRTNTTRVLFKATKTTQLPLPLRSNFKTKDVNFKPSIPPRIHREYAPLQKATTFTRKTTNNFKARRDGFIPGKNYKLDRIIPIDDEAQYLRRLMNIQNIEKALRRSDNTDKDPELLKRISDLEKELKDVKNRLSNVTNVVIVTVTEKAVTVTEKEKMKDNSITQVLFGPYAPEIKKDVVSPDVVTGIMDKKLQDNELNTVTETVVGDFYTDNRTEHEEIPLENTTDFNTKIDDNFAISYPISNADFYYTVPEYPAMRDVLMHSDEAGPWGDSYKFDMIKATKSTPMEVTTPKDNITNSTTTTKPTSLATPIKSSTTLHAARFVLEDAKNDVVSLLLNKKQIPISTLGSSPSILPTNKNISNDTTVETTTVATTNAVDNTTTGFGATFYRTLEPINWEELSTPYGFYRRADGRYVPGYPDLENTFI